MLERAKVVTANGTHTYVEYARYADDLVILVTMIIGRTGSWRPWPGRLERSWRN